MTDPESDRRAILIAGIPATNLTLYHRIRFSVGDPAAYIRLPAQGSAPAVSHLILRDIEMDRARRRASVDEVHCPADFAPPGGLSGDRETATAQAAAEFLKRSGVGEVWTDRTLPMIFVHHVREGGIELRYDPELGVRERRAKDEQEVEHLRYAQSITEQAIELACSTIARAEADADGSLMHDGEPLTSERVREMIDIFLLRKGFQNPRCIVAGGPQGADCHEAGSGPLRTGEPIIVDIFPRNRETLYNGDCTRSVVNGDVPDEVARMHRAVLDAKSAAIGAVRAGVTGEAIHGEAASVIQQHAYRMGLPGEDDPPTYCGMVHGTGHGIGLELHEPPLLAEGGPELVAGDAITVEPGLYSRAIGGIRIEDMVIVRDGGSENLNSLHEGLNWE